MYEEVAAHLPTHTARAVKEAYLRVARDIKKGNRDRYMGIPLEDNEDWDSPKWPPRRLPTPYDPTNRHQDT